MKTFLTTPFLCFVAAAQQTLADFAAIDDYKKNEHDKQVDAMDNRKDDEAWASYVERNPGVPVDVLKKTFQVKQQLRANYSPNHLNRIRDDGTLDEHPYQRWVRHREVDYLLMERERLLGDEPVETSASNSGTKGPKSSKGPKSCKSSKGPKSTKGPKSSKVPKSSDSKGPSVSSSSVDECEEDEGTSEPTEAPTNAPTEAPTSQPTSGEICDENIDAPSCPVKKKEGCFSGSSTSVKQQCQDNNATCCEGAVNRGVYVEACSFDYATVCPNSNGVAPCWFDNTNSIYIYWKLFVQWAQCLRRND